MEIFSASDRYSENDGFTIYYMVFVFAFIKKLLPCVLIDKSVDRRTDD